MGWLYIRGLWPDERGGFMIGDVMLFMCQRRQQHFAEFNLCDFGARKMQEYIFMISISLEWR